MTQASPTAWTRRDFLGHTGSCMAHMALMMAGSAWLPRRLWASQERFPVVAQEPWGRLEQVAEGVWALVSTPLTDRTTLCNGGIVAGRTGVLVVESFGSDGGSNWVAEQAQRLTGRRPTHVVVTHYHGDHTGGLRGAFETADVKLLATSVTRDLTAERGQDPPEAILEGAQLLDMRRPTEIDLGSRSVIVVPRKGHTPSDVSVEVSDPSVIFCGDLVWNDMFPNYMDAIPSRLTLDVRLLQRLEASVYVPGHGRLADGSDLERYATLLDDVEAAARSALERGITAEQAGSEYRIPPELGEWFLFNSRYFERAIGAWMEELGER